MITYLCVKQASRLGVDDGCKTCICAVCIGMLVLFSQSSSGLRAISVGEMVLLWALKSWPCRFGEGMSASSWASDYVQ